MSKPPSTNNLPLKLLALAGYVWMYFDGELMPAGSRPDTEWFYVSLTAALGFFILLVPAREGWRHLLKSWELLVPFGCLECAEHLIALLPIVPAPMDIMNPLTIFGAGAAALLLGLLSLALIALWVTWQTLLILRSLRDAPLDLFDTLRESVPLVPRCTAACLLAILGHMLPIILFISLVPFVGLYIPLLAMLLWTVPWTFATITWLPLAVNSAEPLFVTLGRATGLSKMLAGKWAALLLCWMLSIGYVVVHIYTVSSQQGMSSSTQHSTAWNLNCKWLGAYENVSEWYAKLVSHAELPEAVIYALPLEVLFLAVAIAVKIVIFKHLDRAGALLAPGK